MDCDCIYCRANNPKTQPKILHEIARNHFLNSQIVSYMVRNPATTNETIKIIIQKSEYDYFNFMELIKHPNISEELDISCRATILVRTRIYLS